MSISTDYLPMALGIVKIINASMYTLSCLDSSQNLIKWIQQNVMK